MIDQIYSCYSYLATNWKAPVLSVRLVSLYWSLVLVSASFLLLLRAILLIILLGCAWGRLDNSNGDVARLADGQGIAAAYVLLYWTGWNSGANWSPRNRDLWMSPYGSRYTPRCPWLWICPFCIRYTLKHLWPWIWPCWDTSKHLWPRISPCHSRYTPEETVAHG